MSSIRFVVGQGTPEVEPPVAVPLITPDHGVVGSIIQLDGSHSRGDHLEYRWSFVATPIGSGVASEGFRKLEEDGSRVSFSPDLVGEYIVGLVVYDGVSESLKVTAQTSIRAILVPHARGLVPDGKWIWSYIRDVWTQVENKESFEALWTALIQIVGADLLKAYQTDFEKSIRDIQDLYQRRWLKYDPYLSLVEDDLTWIIGGHRAGLDASTDTSSVELRAVIPSPNTLAIVGGSAPSWICEADLYVAASQDSANVGPRTLASVAGPVVTVLEGLDPTADLIGSTHVSFYAQSSMWTWDGDGDAPSAGTVIYIGTGPNAGAYPVEHVEGSTIYVSGRPATPGVAVECQIHSPVLVRLEREVGVLTDQVAIPKASADLSGLASGRLLCVGGNAYTVSHVALDSTPAIPVNRVVLDRPLAVGGLRSLEWRTPHVLKSASQDFEALGVHQDDALLVEVRSNLSATPFDVLLRVVGVDRNTLGFTLQGEEFEPGEIPPLPLDTLFAMSRALGIYGIGRGTDGAIQIEGQAGNLLDTLTSGAFYVEYGNRPLANETPFVVGDVEFRVRAKGIYRNSAVPVDESLASVPVLQEYIKPPETTVVDGQPYILRGTRRYPVERLPLALTENADYIIDDDVAFDGNMAFVSGTTLVQASNGDFVDRRLAAADSFIVLSPKDIADDYPIASAVDQNRLLLAKPVKLHGSGPVTARVRIVRRGKGKFLRFSPKLFSPTSPAPKRLWAEVSFFDNHETVEKNFGVFVGLRRSDLESISSTVNYRHAVAGLMYAYTRGSSLDRMRLGAHILLGLPFSESRGIIRSIDPDYRRNVDGETTHGRILIEDLSPSGEALGTMRIYVYPIDPLSALSGIEMHPVEGRPYRVGDVVERFSPLCKGVEVHDYLAEPLQHQLDVAHLQQFHSVRMRVNDNVCTFKEIELVSGFLRKITPSYIAFVLQSLTECADTIEVREALFIRLRKDGALRSFSCGLGTALCLDAAIGRFPTARLDDGFCRMRRFGYDLEVSGPDGHMFVIPSGGLLQARDGELYDSAPCAVGDLLVIYDGPNSGAYHLSDVLSDSEFYVAEIPPTGFVITTGQRYAILRKLSPLLVEFSAAMTSGSLVMDSLHGLGSEGVAAGDWCIAVGASGNVFRASVADIQPGGGPPGSRSAVLLDRPYPRNEACVSYIVRSWVIPDGWGREFSVTSTGSEQLTAMSPLLQGLLDVGDEISVLETGLRYTAIAPAQRLFVPAIPAGEHEVLLHKKRDLPLYSSSSWDLQSCAPWEERTLTLLANLRGGGGPVQASMLSGSPVVQVPNIVDAIDTPQGFLSLRIRPGDLFVLEEGNNAGVDKGYGNGVYPIKTVSLSELTLAVNLDYTESQPWKIQRRRRC
jgi:hypothetical protein